MIREQIMNATQKHYDIACKAYGSDHILGVFPYGSINYGLYIPGRSDVDTKAIYIPDLEDLMFNKRVNKELFIINDKNEIEYCEVKDIRDMIYNYQKANINFLETMFTPYSIINPKFLYLWINNFINYRTYIVRGHSYEMCKAAAGQALHTNSQINEWNGKKISNVFRLTQTIKRYILKQNLNDAIYFQDAFKEKLVLYKTAAEKPEDFNNNDLQDAINFCEYILSMDRKTFYSTYNFDVEDIDSCKEIGDSAMKRGAKKMVSLLLRRNYDE